MRLAIVGSRTFEDYNRMREFILENTNVNNINLIVSGGAKGADKLGEKFADTYKIKKKIFYPDWKTYGKRAGFIRNRKIVENSDMVIAFWDGISSGTKNTIETAKFYGKKILIDKSERN